MITAYLLRRGVVIKAQQQAEGLRLCGDGLEGMLLGFPIEQGRELEKYGSA